uniref:Uncharacterized protein n=1 Tax=Salix viminalis TaxID=40686 RepID=A0A6N2MVJ0_SALVM
MQVIVGEKTEDKKNRIAFRFHFMENPRMGFVCTYVDTSAVYIEFGKTYTCWSFHRWVLSRDTICRLSELCGPKSELRVSPLCTDRYN